MFSFLKKKSGAKSPAPVVLSIKDPFTERLAEGIRLHQANQWLEAAAIYDAILQENPEHPSALHYRGVLNQMAGDPVSAGAYFERSLASALEPDPATLSNLAVTWLDRGDPEKAEALLREAIALQPVFPDAYANLGNALRMRGAENEALAAYEQAIAQKPEHLNALFALGTLHQQRGESVKALMPLQKALGLAPDRAELLGAMGLALFHAGRAAEGFRLMTAACEKNPLDRNGWVTLGVALFRENRISDATDIFRRAQMLGFDDAEIGKNLADLDVLSADYAAGADGYRRVLDKNPDPELRIQTLAALGVAMHSLGQTAAAIDLLNDAEALCEGPLEHLRSLVRFARSEPLLASGNLPSGLSDLEARFSVVSFLKDPPKLPSTRWTGDADLNGKSILVWMEQGLGDVIQFSRFAIEIKRRYPDARVILGAPASLVTLLSSMAEIDKVVALGKDPDPVVDYDIPLMNQPLALGTTLSDLSGAPYLRVAPNKRLEWASRLGRDSGRLRVGLVWAGSPMANHVSESSRDRVRSMSLSDFAPILAVPDVDFYSLQLYISSVPAGELPTLRARDSLPDNLIDLTADIHDFTDTAALIEQLDLVIGVDTSTIHCAGALGKPVWLLNRKNTCWRWFLEGEDSPWYDQLRIFRQPSLGDWGSVTQRVAGELTKLVESRRETERAA